MRNQFTIYKNCEHPEAAMRLANLIADPDWSIQAMYGMYGDTYLSKKMMVLSLCFHMMQIHKEKTVYQ